MVVSVVAIAVILVSRCVVLLVHSDGCCCCSSSSSNAATADTEKMKETRERTAATMPSMARTVNSETAASSCHDGRNRTKKESDVEK